MSRFVLVITLIGFASASHAGMSSGSYDFDPLDVNGGGETLASSSYSISTSTGQSGGVGQITSAMSNLDQTTRQSAASGIIAAALRWVLFYRSLGNPQGPV